MPVERIKIPASTETSAADLCLSEIEGMSHPHGVVRMRCPNCHHNTRLDAFESFAADVEVRLVGDASSTVLGIRHCPDVDCGQIVFVAYADDDGPRLLYSSPAESLDFDETNLPETVVKSLREAATCFSQGCHTAAAIMIRKTLEEVCAERGATGDNLKQRIEGLGTVVIVPRPLLEGLDALRLLGNDAAHIESQTFNQVGREEVGLSFEVVKEFLKAIYQYEALIEGLASLKRKQERGSGE